MPFVGAGFKPAPTVNGKNDACLGGFPWRVQVCNRSAELTAKPEPMGLFG